MAIMAGYLSKRGEVFQRNDLVRIDINGKTLIVRISDSNDEWFNYSSFEYLQRESYNGTITAWRVRPASELRIRFSEDSVPVLILRKANMQECLTYIKRCSKKEGFNQYLKNEN